MTTTPPPAGTGMCMGTVDVGNMPTIGGTTYLAVKDQGQIVLLQGSGNVFGLAECECRSRDILMAVQLSMAVPQGTSNLGVSMWLGMNDCNDPTKRSLMNYQCEQITAASPPGNSSLNLDTIAGDFKAIGPFYIPIPAESLTNPKPVLTTTDPWPWSCDVSGIQNRTVSLLVGPDPTPATCTLPLTINLTPPQAPTTVNLSSGDSALDVSWSIPDGTTGIDYYQILCRKQVPAGGTPVPPTGANNINNTAYWFSSCINGTLYRRPLPGLATPDNMTSNSGVMPWYPSPDMAVIPDGGADMTGVTPPDMTGIAPPDMTGVNPPDMTAAAADGGSGPAVPFPVDPRYICSDKISATGTALSQRISGLDNGSVYEVMVVSIDPYGNPSPSAVVTATPQATESPLQGFCDSNGGTCPTGFGCQFGPGPVGASAFGLFWLSSCLLLHLKRRWRREGRVA